MGRRKAAPRPDVDAQLAAVEAVPFVVLDPAEVERTSLRRAAHDAVRACPESRAAHAAIAALPPGPERRDGGSALIAATASLVRRSVRAHSAMGATP